MVPALLLFGCRGEPVFHCTKTAPRAGFVRVCKSECPFGECFQRERAHCFMEQKALCSPTPEECDGWRRYLEVGRPCTEMRADEI